MERLMFVAVPAIMMAIGCQQAIDRFEPDQIIATERAALDRWGRGDPQGFLEIMAPEVTYFDLESARTCRWVGGDEQSTRAAHGEDQDRQVRHGESEGATPR